MNDPTPPDEELKNQIIQFQKDTLAEWDNPLGRNVDMIKLAYKFAALIHDREAKAERRGMVKAIRKALSLTTMDDLKAYYHELAQSEQEGSRAMLKRLAPRTPTQREINDLKPQKGSDV